MRISDAVNGVVKTRPFEEISRYVMAFRLDDGSWDGELYPSMADARRHQKGDDNLYAYLFLRSAMAGIPHKEAFAWLSYCRMVHDLGGRMPDPDSMRGNSAPVMPLTNEDWAQKVDLVLAQSGYDISRYLKD